MEYIKAVSKMVKNTERGFTLILKPMCDTKGNIKMVLRVEMERFTITIIVLHTWENSSTICLMARGISLTMARRHLRILRMALIWRD